MPNTSLAQALTDLYTHLTATAMTGVSKVYDHEPGAIKAEDRSVTVSCAGITPDDFQLAVRIYVKVSDARNAQDRIYDLVQVVDARLGQRVGNVTPWGPSRWDIGYDADSGAHIAQTLLDAGRQDYF